MRGIMSDLSKIKLIADEHDLGTILRKTQEECGELIASIGHFCLGKCDRDALVDEIADVSLQLQYILEKMDLYFPVNERKYKKLEKVIKRIENDNKIKYLIK